MSLNLGPVAFEAIQKLKGTSEWQAFKGVLVDQMGRFMHSAIETGPTGNAVDACGYARALRDMVWAIEQNEKAPLQVRARPDVPLYPEEDPVNEPPSEEDLKAGAAVSNEAQRRADPAHAQRHGRR